MSLPSLPPPRRATSTGVAARRPKVNPNSLALAAREASSLDQADGEEVDKALAQLLSQTHIIHPDHLHQPHLPQCRHYTRPRSIASISSLGSEYVGSQSRRTSQAPRSPLFPDLNGSEPTSTTPSATSAYFNTHASARPCPSCHSYSCPSLAICEDDGEAIPFCQRGDNRMKSLFPDDEAEQSMSDVGGSFLSCSYCSSVRSSSVASLDDGQHHLHLHQQTPKEHLFDNQRMDHLKNLVPTEVRRKLSFHVDECWFVHFSPSGEYLASIGLDYSIVLWQNLTSPEPTVFRTINFTRTITSADWSPNSKYFLVNFGHDLGRPELIPEVCLVDVESGEVLFKRRHKTDTHYVPASAIGWFSDSERFLTALDDGLYRVWNVKGEIVHEYAVERNLTAHHMKMIPGKDEAVVITKDYTIEIISFTDKVSTRQLDQLTTHVSASIVSWDGTYLALGFKADKELHRPAQIGLYNLNTMSFMKYFEADTYADDFFMIIPSFVGPNQELLCAGSENGQLNYWDVESGEVIAVLEEHLRHAGCTTVNPHNPGMLASCSDDNLIIIWVTKNIQRELQSDDEKWLNENRPATTPVLDLKKNW